MLTFADATSSCRFKSSQRSDSASVLKRKTNEKQKQKPKIRLSEDLFDRKAR